MRVATLCSGGKDSSQALWLAMREHKIACIIAMVPEREDSWMFHTSNIELIDMFAECAALPLNKVKTSGVKELELEDMKRALAKLDIEGVVSGAIASKYQKTRIDLVCRELNIKHVTPLWGRDPVELLRELIEARFKAIVTSVSAYGLNESWLGREIDESAVCDLIELHRKYKVSPCGEGGEFETIVLDAPFFKKKIEVVEAERDWLGDRGYLLIKKTRVVEK